MRTTATVCGTVNCTFARTERRFKRVVDDGNYQGAKEYSHVVEATASRLLSVRVGQ